MKPVKMEKGHYIASGNIQAIDGRHMLAFGDEFDIIHIHKNDRVDVLLNQESLTFDSKNLFRVSIPLSH
ncbi:hypothetical protein SG34_011310 [Thalassomonas viridans]|uniref:Uncharacterized protein n=1 Tax=Thalassomonas viridans TaxID=137584 RepID=A0AAE9Z8U4_9GAMM|nr:hypothetical protein [Thalassomonas viridans]WDE07418.1 hypothetical protein SG34_011310 [Thalassomonas viridans]